jgi:hypothetical protein
MASPLLAALVLAVTQAPAAAPEAGSLAWLHSNWQGSGTMFGRPSQARLEIRPTLGGRFIELNWRASGFEGRAFYSTVSPGRWCAIWFDNRGISFAIDATLSGRTLTGDWGSAETERGRTIYRLLPDSRLEVTDTAGGRGFASHILARAD